jgi:hypothetical protein
MIGGLRSLHELELASAARMVVAVDFDILFASGGPSTGAEASTNGTEGCGDGMEPKTDALERVAAIDPSPDASPRSAPRPPRVVHAVVPTSIARTIW